MMKKVPKRRFKGFLNAGDWEQRKLGEIANINPRTELPNSFKYVDLESVIGTNLIGCKKIEKENAPSRAQRLASFGDIFYQTVRPYQRNNYLFEKEDDDVVFSTGYAQLRSELDSYFLFTLVQTDSFVSKVLDHCTGTSYPAINSSELGKILISAPQNKLESHQIGTIFRVLDNLITLHQRKLEKLQATKKALLYELFPIENSRRPKRRFKGFTDDWEQRKLGELGKTFNGLTGKTKKDFGHGDAQYITYLNVFQNTISDLSMTERIEIDKSQNTVQYGDILFTTSSETPEEVGMSSVWLGEKPNTYLNSFCFGYRPTVDIDHQFMGNLLRSPHVRNEMKILAQGISRYNISKNKVMDLEITLPSKEEQKLIGSILNHIDSQLTLHQRKLEKLKNLKAAYLNEMFV